MWRRYFPRRDRRDVFVVVANLARAAPKRVILGGFFAFVFLKTISLRFR